MSSTGAPDAPPENRERSALSDERVGQSTEVDRDGLGGASGEASSASAGACDVATLTAPDPQKTDAVPATDTGVSETVAEHRPRPAGRTPARAGYRRVRRLDVAHAGVGSWGTALFVVGLTLLSWALPFAGLHPRGAEAWLDVPTVAHPHPAASVAPLLSIDALGVTLDGRRVASAADVAARGEDALDPLARDLEIVRRNWALLRPSVPYPGRIALRVAPGTPWARIRPVLVRAARAGHARVAFLVRAPPREAPDFDWARFSPR